MEPNMNCIYYSNLIPKWFKNACNFFQIRTFINYTHFFQTHLVCVVPPYRRPDITEPVSVRLCVVSSGKTSESHQFVYTPVNGAVPSGKFSLYIMIENLSKRLTQLCCFVHIFSTTIWIYFVWLFSKTCFQLNGIYFSITYALSNAMN